MADRMVQAFINFPALGLKAGDIGPVSAEEAELFKGAFNMDPPRLAYVDTPKAKKAPAPEPADIPTEA